MKKILVNLILSFVMIVLSLSMIGCKKPSILDPKNPTTITIWNYYNGAQLSAFDSLITEFNNTIGLEVGIVATSVSPGNIDTLSTTLIDSVDGKVGAALVPSAAAIYSETAYILNKKDAIIPINEYFSDKELDEYFSAFIDEGRLTEGGDLFLIPVSKSTEAFIINKTDITPFLENKNISLSDINSYEKLTEYAKEYYEFTDALTSDVSNDGKALYGIDSMANYIYVGAKQLGHELFVVKADGDVIVDLDKNTFKKLWDNYYIPYICGYFKSEAKFRSEDLKTGTILSMTGSTSGATYIPTMVTDKSDLSHNIEIEVNKALCFENCESVYVQQGASYCIMKTNEKEQYATAEFFKWITQTEQNLDFSVLSGYSPVMKKANDKNIITSVIDTSTVKNQNMLKALLVSAEIYASGNTYTCRSFNGSKEIRNIIENSMKNIAIADRKSVKDLLDLGKTLEEATNSYTSSTYFDNWYNGLCAQINEIVS